MLHTIRMTKTDSTALYILIICLLISVIGGCQKNQYRQSEQNSTQETADSSDENQSYQRVVIGPLVIPKNTFISAAKIKNIQHQIKQNLQCDQITVDIVSHDEFNQLELLANQGQLKSTVFIKPAITTLSASFNPNTGIASWHGVERKIAVSGSQPTDKFNIPVSSLKLISYDSETKKIVSQNSGGIEIIASLGADNSIEYRHDLFEDSHKINDAICIAAPDIKPLPFQMLSDDSSCASLNPDDLLTLQIKNLIPPKYPKEAAKYGIIGNVTVIATLKSNGYLEKISIIHAEPEGIFDETVLTTLKQWQFQAVCGFELPESMNIKQRVEFRMDKNSVIFPGQVIPKPRKTDPFNLSFDKIYGENVCRTIQPGDLIYKDTKARYANEFCY